MPGVLTHLIVAVAGFLLIGFLSKWKYGLVFIVGTIIPDAIKFGIPGIQLRTINFYTIVASKLFNQIRVYSDSFFVWIGIFVICILGGFLLFKFEKIGWKSFKNWLFLNLSFVVAVIIHLIMDIFIIEKSYWI